ncbi:MAG: Ldh family oxidoreductase [Chloroflexi bacterium]|nr:Ldh family oxidoreductase [Chloroflexota bacterium]
MPTLAVDRLRLLSEQIFVAAGATRENATRVTRALVEANLAGHDSHGVQAIPHYVREVKDGRIVPTARPALLRDSPSIALVTGNWGFGHVAAEYATHVAVAKAKESNVAAVALVQANHIGRVGEYAEMAAAAGVVTIIAAGGFAEERPAVAPYGGARPVLGTNPISMGFPAGEMPSMLLDFATTTVAGGKVTLAVAKGTPVPPGALLDRHGNPTTDPKALADGGVMLPFGGHKGFALSMAVEFLGRIATGADTHHSSTHGGPVFSHSGTLIFALDPSAFQPFDQYASRADDMLRRVKAIPPAPGFSEVLVPGEPEHQSREARRRDGIPIPDSTWAAILATAEELGVTTS